MSSEIAGATPRPIDDGGTVAEDGVASGPIVVEMDRSYEAGEALRWASDVGAALSREVVALGVWHPGIGELRPDARAAAQRRHEEMLREWCARVPLLSTPSHAVVEGDGPSAIPSYAERVGASLVVTGLALHGSHLPFVGDSIARRLAHESPTALAVVPAAGAARPMRRIVVGVDDDSQLESLVGWPVRLASAVGAEVEVVRVDPYQADWLPANSPRSALEKDRRALEQRCADAFGPAGVSHQVEVLEGSDSMQGWEHLAQREHADLIVMFADPGGRRHGGRAAHSIALARRSSLPVLVVPIT
jgi:nucleotide-binding universal stress UspA family protein